MKCAKSLKRTKESMGKNLFSCLSFFVMIISIVGVENVLAFDRVNAKKAFEMVCATQPEAILIDVRTPEEIVWVGSPACKGDGVPISYLAPVKLWKGIDNEGKSLLKLNEEFVEVLLDNFGRYETLIMMCSSGGRSELAAKLLEQYGFSDIKELDGLQGGGGFQGKKDPDTGYRGYPGRIKPDTYQISWMDTGLPMTQKVDPKKILMSLEDEYEYDDDAEQVDDVDD